MTELNSESTDVVVGPYQAGDLLLALREGGAEPDRLAKLTGGIPASLLAPGTYATPTQGALAESALQPGDGIPWTDVTGKPAAFPPSLHFHEIGDVTGLQVALDGKQAAGSYATGAQGALADTALQPGAQIPWTDVTGRPATFPPAAHSHVIADTTGLQTALDGKAALTHTHPASAISDSTAAGRSMLTAADAAAQRTLLSVETTAQLNARDTANRSRANHTGTQDWATITGTPATFPPSAHTHADATTGAAGFMSAADKTKLDGIAAGAQVNVPTDLTYAPSTRLLASSTGADVTLPLMSDANAGLVPASGGGTTNFLRADGVFAPPPGGGGGSSAWGGITGTLSAQTDLQAALDAKADIAAPLGLWDWWYEWRVGSTSATGSDMFTGSAISSGTATTGPATASVLGYNPFGVLLRSSATINSGFRYQTSHLGTNYFGDIAQKFRCQFSWPTALADRTVRAGYLDTQNSSDATDGAYFEIVSGVAFIKTALNNVRTTGGTTLALALNVPYTFEIDVDAAGSSARFRIWQGTNETPVYDETLTTNIPTASARAFGAGLVATYGVAAAADIGVFYTIGIGTVAGFQRATGRT